MTIRRIVGVAAVVVLQATVAANYAHAGASVALPEPTTLALVGIGAGVLAVGAWWRNRQK